MRHLPLLLLATVALTSCATPRPLAGPGDIEARLVALDSAYQFGGPVPVEIHLQNVGKHAIRIPDHAHYKSNLYLTGLDRDHSGLEMRFDFRPVPEWSQTIIMEPIMVSNPRSYAKLQPGEAIVFEHDFNKHLGCVLENCGGTGALEPGTYSLALAVISAPPFSVPRDVWTGTALADTVTITL